MGLSELGEFGLIERLRRALPRAPQMLDDSPSAHDRLVVGIGDDAAVWRTGDAYTLATTDTLVAGVHFLPDAVSWQDVGWKALATNISDIAAMGGIPTFALVTLCLPSDMPVSDIDGLYEGLAACADDYGVAIVGGDIVSAAVFSITVALMADASTDASGAPLLLRRSAARVGDVIAVTNTLGASAGGLRALTDHAPHTDARRRLIKRHMRPVPILILGRMALEARVRCAIDISDGLVQDLGHICAASGVAAELRLADVPVDADLVAEYPDDAVAMAATGGEDYELIVVGAQDAIARAESAFEGVFTIVGRIIDGDARVRVLDAFGMEVALPADGWDHFGKDRPT